MNNSANVCFPWFCKTVLQLFGNGKGAIATRSSPKMILKFLTV